MEVHQSQEVAIVMDVDLLPQTYGCQWDWCRLSFSSNSALVEHVIKDHVNRAIPVLRRDIPMLKRAEEGMGESLKLSGLMRGPSSSASQNKSEQLQHAMAKGSFESSQHPPTSSLPSPPTSSPSPALHSPIPRDTPVDDDTSSRFNQKSQRAEVFPSFAALNSPAGSLASLKLPASPSFSDLVKGKRKLTFDAPESSPNKHPRLHPLSQQSTTFSSTASQQLVADHLTQSAGVDEDEDEDDDESYSNGDSDNSSGSSDSDADNEDEEVEEQPKAVAPPSSRALVDSLPLSSQQDLYNGEIRWGSTYSQVNSSQATSRSALEAQPQELIAQFDSFSQPPSQLQVSSFPFHSHSPKPSPTSLRPIQTELDRRSSLPMSSPASAPPPNFATSTPQRQAWYQGPVVRKHSSSKKINQVASNDNTPKASPQNVTPRASQSLASKASSISPTKNPVFRSGTLRMAPGPSTRTPSPEKVPAQVLTPTPAHPESKPQPDAPSIESQASAAALMRDVMAARDDSYNSWTDSQSDMYTSSQLSQDLSYPPLQTQAPYQSQTLSELD